MAPGANESVLWNGFLRGPVCLRRVLPHRERRESYLVAKPKALPG
jgi:hypothetical protein